MATLERDGRRELSSAALAGAFAGIGAALPERVVPNAEITRAIGVEDDWIVRRTGIRERRYAQRGAQLHELAARAAAGALADASLPASAIDLVLVASCSPDAYMPNVAPQVAHAIGTPQAAAFDIGAACTGFIAALGTARAMIASGAARNALVIGAEIMSRYVDPADRNTAAIFGDGAGAAVLSAAGAGGLGPVVLGSDGGHSQLIVSSPGTQLMAMDGHETFRQAVRRMGEASRGACEAAGVALADLDLYVYHQANSRILASLSDRLELDPARVVDCIATLGNTSGASIPLALAHARAEGRLRAGSRVLLCAAGAGFTWGATVLTWGLAA